MKKLLVILLMSFSILGVACTSQQRAKKFGGEANIALPKGKKLVVATWKEDNLWLLYRDRKHDETVESYSFKESSSWGMFEGIITIKER